MSHYIEIIYCKPFTFLIDFFLNGEFRGIFMTDLLGEFVTIPYRTSEHVANRST